MIGPVLGRGDDLERRFAAGADRAGRSVRRPRARGRPWASCSGLGGPVFRPIAGAARTSTTAPISDRDQRRAPQRRVDDRPSAASVRSAPRRSASGRRWARAGSAAPGRRRWRRATLRTTTIASVPASEASSEPGTMNSETSIESSRVLPAKTVVRPAVRRVARAASSGLGPAGQLLAEAGDHQQRVVDPQRQAHHRADGQREGVDVEPGGEEVEDPARGDHRDRAEGERDRGRDRRAEDEQQDDQQERQRDQLAALGGGDRFVLDRPRERGVAGLGRSDRRRGSPLRAPRSSSGDGLVDGRLRCRRGSRRGSAPGAGSGRSRSTEPRSQGERVVTFGSRRRARTSSGPWRSIAAARAARAGSRTGRESPKCSRSSSLAREESVPGMLSVVGSSRSSTPVPITPSATRTQRRHGQDRPRMAQRQWRAAARIRSRGLRPAPARPPSHPW